MKMQQNKKARVRFLWMNQTASSLDSSFDSLSSWLLLFFTHTILNGRVVVGFKHPPPRASVGFYLLVFVWFLGISILQRSWCSSLSVLQADLMKLNFSLLLLVLPFVTLLCIQTHESPIHWKLLIISSSCALFFALFKLLYSHFWAHSESLITDNDTIHAQPRLASFRLYTIIARITKRPEIKTHTLRSFRPTL